MRIIHTSDWHLGKNLEGASRMEEQERFIDFFVERCESLKPDLILIAGDIYDTANPPARAEKLFYDALKKLSRNGDCITLVIAGNHDNPDRIVSATPLAMEHGIVMLGTPKTIVPLGNYGKHQVVNSGEGFVELDIAGERVVAVAVPYPSEKRLNEIFYKDDQDEEERVESYGEKLASLFHELGKNFRKDTINLTVSHLFAMNASPDGSERASSLGGSFMISLDALPQNADYTALGHIHKPQILAKTDRHIRYSGSPIHYSAQEHSLCKKFFVIDIHCDLTGKRVEIDEVDIPIFKPIEQWKADSIEHAIELCKEHSGEESWVYLEIKTDRPILESEIKEMKSYKKDILEIRPAIAKIQELSAIHRISELSFEEQFVEFYKAQKGIEPTSEMVEMFLSLTQEDEDETDTSEH